MDQRRTTTSVAKNVTDALTASDEAIESLAVATDTTIPQMKARLSGAVDFTWAELVAVGGFFCVQPDQFFKGVKA